MKVHNQISELINKKSKDTNDLDKLIVNAERLSETISSYARTDELNEQSGGEAYECRSATDAEKTIQDNQEFSDLIKTIANDISRIDHPNSSNILNASTEDLHRLFHENEEKIRSLEKESEEAYAIYSRVADKEKRAEKAIEALRKERADIASTLEKQKKQKAADAEKQKTERESKQRQKAADAKMRTATRKRQTSQARWLLVVVVLGLIAFRLTTLGG